LLVEKTFLNKHFILHLLRKHLSQQAFFFEGIDFYLFWSLADRTKSSDFSQSEAKLKMGWPKKAKPDLINVKNKLKQQKGWQ
jgi:hypothetical protein